MKERVIIALDYPESGSAKALVQTLGDAACYYKVGLELFLHSKGEIITYLKEQEKKVFLDLKFHDIPNTVAQAVKWATQLGVDMFNVHATGGEVMLQRAAEAVEQASSGAGIPRPKLIGVTVLTSFDAAVFQRVGFAQDIGTTAHHLARQCKAAGLDGVVCSALEARAIKDAHGEDFLTVCPGIRPAGAAVGDQKRIVTPHEAIQIGVDHMVIGRPITQAPAPQAALAQILAEIATR